MKITRILLAIGLLWSNNFIYTTESSVEMRHRKNMEEIDRILAMYTVFGVFVIVALSIAGIIQHVHIKSQSLQIKKPKTWMEWLKFCLAPCYPVYRPYMYPYSMYAPMVVYY